MSSHGHVRGDLGVGERQQLFDLGLLTDRGAEEVRCIGADLGQVLADSDSLTDTGLANDEKWERACHVDFLEVLAALDFFTRSGLAAFMHTLLKCPGNLQL